MKIRVSLLRASMLAVVAGVAFLPVVASALSATYVWVPNPGSGGSGTIVLNDPNITNPASFGFPGAIVDDDSVVSLSFTFPVSGLTFTLADFNLQNVANNTAIGGAGWTASGGQLTTTFQFSGNSPTIQYLRVASSGGPSLNDLGLLPSGPQEAHQGVWALIPEPSTALLLSGGLAVIGGRRKG